MRRVGREPPSSDAAQVSRPAAFDERDAAVLPHAAAAHSADHTTLRAISLDDTAVTRDAALDGSIAVRDLPRAEAAGESRDSRSRALITSGGNVHPPRTPAGKVLKRQPRDR
jgi:hypothetical protein